MKDGPKKGNEAEFDLSEMREKINSGQADGVQYLQKAKAVQTGIKSPIQRPVVDEQPLLSFVKQNHDDTIPKMWGVSLKWEAGFQVKKLEHIFA